MVVAGTGVLMMLLQVSLLLLLLLCCMKLALPALQALLLLGLLGHVAPVVLLVILALQLLEMSCCFWCCWECPPFVGFAALPCMSQSNRPIHDGCVPGLLGSPKFLAPGRARGRTGCVQGAPMLWCPRSVGCELSGGTQAQPPPRSRHASGFAQRILASNCLIFP